ncbi:hypothetical protein U9M48_017908, partial [Paspalum notatum var. saurae]
AAALIAVSHYMSTAASLQDARSLHPQRPLIRDTVLGEMALGLADAELCKDVGIKKFKSIPNRSLPSPVANWSKCSLFGTRDSRWSAMRNIIVSIYQPSHLAGLIPSMGLCIERAATNLDDGKEVVFSKLSLNLATDVIGQAAFGADFGMSRKPPAPGDGVDDGGDAEKASSELINIMHHATNKSLKMDLSGSLSNIVGTFVPFLQKPLRQMLMRVPGSADHEITRVNGELCRLMDGIVSGRVRVASSSMERAPQQHKDFLSVVLTARERNASTRELLSPDYVSALTYEHFLAGASSTAFTQKLLKEIDAFGPHDDGVPTAEDLHTKFPYLDQVYEPNYATLLKTLPKSNEFLKTIMSFGKVTQEQKEEGSKYGLSIYSWDEFLSLAAGQEFDLPDKEKTDICTIMYTSGTTGDPKGVLISNASIICLIAGVDRLLNCVNEELAESDVYMSYDAHIFDRVVEELFIFHGASIGFWRGDVKLLVEDIGVLKPTIMCAVPRVLDRIFSDCFGIDWDRSICFTTL